MEKQLCFDWFEGGRPPRGEYAITILSTGVINFSQAFYDEKLTEYKYVQFGFNKEKEILAIKPLSLKTTGAYKIRTTKKAKNPGASAHAFLKAINLKHEESRRYPAEWDDEMNIALVNLSDKD